MQMEWKRGARAHIETLATHYLHEWWNTRGTENASSRGESEGMRPNVLGRQSFLFPPHFHVAIGF